jgi:hypothetical protein
VRTPGHGHDDVLLTVPARAEFGDVARRAVGELARRQGFDSHQWADLEAAVGQTLRLLRQGRGERVRFRFVPDGSAIAVEAELTGDPDIGDRAIGDTDIGDRAIGDRGIGDRAIGGRSQRLCRGAIDDFRALIEPLVDGTEVDGVAGLVRFVSKARRQP